MSFPKRIFISHSSKDRDFVEREIISLLKTHGIGIWYSKDDIRSSSQWKRVIVEALKSCDWFLVGLSPRSITSPWVEAEVDWAFDNRRDHFVPVVIEECAWDEFNLLLRNLQNVNFSTDPQDARRRLLQTWDIPLAHNAAMPSLPSSNIAAPFDPAKSKQSEERESHKADRFELQCPNGHRVAVKQSLRGASVKCPACSITFVVPQYGEQVTRAAPVESVAVPLPNVTIPKATGDAKQLRKIISLTEAADLLGIDKDELLRRVKCGEVRGFRDRSEWKFMLRDLVSQSSQ